MGWGSVYRFSQNTPQNDTIEDTWTCKHKKIPVTAPVSAIVVAVSAIKAFLRAASTFNIKPNQSKKIHPENTYYNTIVRYGTALVAAAPFLSRLPEFPVIKSTPLREDEE